MYNKTPSYPIHLKVLYTFSYVILFVLLCLIFPQVGLHGQEFPEDVTPPTFLSACPVEAGLVDLPGDEGRDNGEPTARLTLADTIAPHWFSPPEGTLYIIPRKKVFQLLSLGIM